MSDTIQTTTAYLPDGTEVEVTLTPPKPAEKIYEGRRATVDGRPGFFTKNQNGEAHRALQPNTKFAADDDNWWFVRDNDSNGYLPTHATEDYWLGLRTTTLDTARMPTEGARARVRGEAGYFTKNPPGDRAFDNERYWFVRDNGNRATHSSDRRWSEVVEEWDVPEPVQPAPVFHGRRATVTRLDGTGEVTGVWGSEGNYWRFDPDDGSEFYGLFDKQYPEEFSIVVEWDTPEPVRGQPLQSFQPGQVAVKVETDDLYDPMWVRKVVVANGYHADGSFDKIFVPVETEECHSHWIGNVYERTDGSGLGGLWEEA